jgi:prevent-host-death family protein
MHDNIFLAGEAAMDVITERDAVENIQTLIERVEHGEEVTITRDGRPVAKIVRVENDDQLLDAERRARQKAAVEGIRSLGARVRLDGLSIRQLIEEGRR